jgi:CubicO group peptidase (beta-lactamase class C family)
MTASSLSTSAATRVIEHAIAARVFPAAAVDIGGSDGPLWSQAFGALTFDEPDAAASIATPFDLASLTKVVATTTVAMNLAATGALRLDQRVGDLLSEWRGGDRDAVTVADLLEHTSGLPARLVDAPPTGRREFEHDICAMPLEYTPRTASIYSDLGFILLAFVLADRSAAPLATQFDVLWRRLDQNAVTFALAPAVRRLAAPTMPMLDDPRRGRILRGEVHDYYAAALGGAAGHAGLFGTAAGVGAFARVILRALRGDTTLPAPWTPDVVRRFAAKSSVPGSSRALGWDTMLRSSSCGTQMSASAIGHAGFTGTSLWIDPARDRYFVLLTNRVCGGGTLEQMRAVRREFHDAINI